MKRRDFFRVSMPMLSAPFFLNSTMASTFNSFDLLNTLDCDTIRDRFLVIVQLKGANDGLNTIIRPENDALYNAQRSSVYLNPGDLLTSSESAYDGIAMHPSMAGIRDLCNDGSVNIIQSVGYPTMNRSHFRATDLWLTGEDGLPKANPSQYGWMGKYLEYIYEGYGGAPSSFMPDPLGVHLRSKSPSLGFHTSSEHLKAINLSVKDSGYYTLLSEYGTSSQYFDNLHCNTRSDYMKILDQGSLVYGQQVLDRFNNGSNSSTDYGSYDLGSQLKTVARLVNGGSQTKIFLTEMTGFDTHVNQVAKHASLLDELSSSVSNFMEDLENLGLMDRCLIVTFSEFGRKFTDNQGNGTDHGTLAPMMVFGQPDKINAGLSGPPINVSTLDAQGAPLVTDSNNIDYREVFISIMKQWLGANQNAVDATFGNYERQAGAMTVDLIPDSANATPSQGTPLCFATAEQEQTHEFTIEVPILPPLHGSDEPALVEITACDYVDLLPGFVAATGNNVIVYPYDCPPAPGGGPPPLLMTSGPDIEASLAVFKPEALTEFVTEQVQYTRKEDKENEIKLIEKFDQREEIKMKIYPNPTTDFINISFNLRAGENKVRLDVLDLKARMVPVQMPAIQKSATRYQVRINIAHLIPGTYFLRYQSDKLVETFKFVKM